MRHQSDSVSSSVQGTTGFKKTLKYFLFFCFILLGTTCGYYIGDYLYDNEQRREAEGLAQTLSKTLSNISLAPVIKIIDGLAATEAVITTALKLSGPDNPEVLQALNLARDLVDSSLVYVLDKKGLVVACTPYGEGGRYTLTGNNYGFREYFSKAVQTKSAVSYPALGVTTGRRGIYVSHPIFADNIVAGVLVFKMKLETIDSILASQQYPSAWFSPEGVIIASNKEDWLFRTTLPITDARLLEIQESRQFGDKLLQPLLLDLQSHSANINNTKYISGIATTQMKGWKALILKSDSSAKSLFPLYGMIGGATCMLLLSSSVFYLIEKRRSRMLLSEQGYRLKLALAGGELGTWDWHIPSGHIKFDSRWAQMLGYEINDLDPSMDTWKELACAEDIPGVTEKLEQHLSGQTPLYEAVFRMRHQSGDWIWILSKGQVINRDNNGEPIRVCGTHLDISSQKNLENELRIEHEKLLNILDSAPVGFLIISKDRTIVWVNSYTLEFSGCESIDELINSSCRDFLCFKKDELCSLGGEGGELHNIESVFRRKNGEEVPIVKTVKEIEFEGQEALLEIFIDISRLKRLELELLQAQKLESVGRLAAGISHEINTPTQFIATNLDFLDESYSGLQNLLSAIPESIASCEVSLRDNVKSLYEDADWEYLQEEIPEALAQTKQGIEHVSSIVSAMKRFSHPYSKERAPCDLNEIIETSITISKGEWKIVAKVETNLDPDVGQPPLIADEIGQALLNIIVNATQAVARKYQNNGTGQRGRIVISSQRNNDKAVVRIEDNGCGVPEDIIDKIFDPFFSTKEVGSGTGQGLAICYDVIVNKHNGTLDVDSKENEGTVFIITLPCV